MTYAEVNARLVRLMYVAHEKRWIDPSLRNLTGDWIRRVEERLSNVNDSGTKVSALQSYEELNDPSTFLRKFLSQYPEAENQILASADVSYFLAISQRRGQKVSLNSSIESSFRSLTFPPFFLFPARSVHPYSRRLLQYLVQEGFPLAIRRYRSRLRSRPSTCRDSPRSDGCQALHFDTRTDRRHARQH